MIAKIEEITNYLNTKLFEFDIHTIDKDNNGLFGGKLGLIYYYFNMYKLKNKTTYLDKITELLENIFENIQNENYKISSEVNFNDGLSGLGFILNELINADILDENYSEQLTVINDLALDYTLKKIAEHNFDFFYGAIGGLFYLSEVGQIKYCEVIIEALYDYATKNNFLYYSQNEDEFNRGVNFGLAHGNTAIFIILLNLVKKGLKNKQLLALINKGIPELLKYEKEEKIEKENTKIYFPHNFVIENGIKKINRSNILGWCNSELDISILIQKYSEVMNDKIFNELSNKIGIETVKRKTEHSTGIYDYHFCHGSSGVAQLYSKLYEQTQIEVYDIAYIYWMNETINYLEKEKDADMTESKIHFLYGWPAAILSINTYNNNKIKGWDKLFLI